MGKPIAIIGILLIAIVGAAVFLVNNKEKMLPAEQVAPLPTIAQQDNAGSLPQPTPGAYISYRDNVISATRGEKILFFHAAWCPQCRALEADIHKNGVPQGVTIIKIDYDTSQPLRQKYGVTLQTTLVKVDDNGNLLKKFVAYNDPSMAAIIRELL